MKSFLTYLYQKINALVDGLTSELSQNKTLLCWVYSIAYLILIRYCVIHNATCMNTAIMTTGGICGTIFSAWVIGSSHVDATRLRFPTPPDPTEPEDPTDPGL